MVGPEEFVPQEGKVPVVVIAPYGNSFAEAIEKLQEDSLVQLVECKTTLEAASIIHGMPCALILFHSSQVQDVVPQITLLKLLKNEIQSGKVRALLTTYIDEVAVLSKLAFYGCAEVVPEPIPGRSLLFKLQRHIKALEGNAAQKKKEAQPVSKEKKSLSSSKSNTKQAEAPMFRYSNPLEIGKEEWSFSQSPPKKIGRRWLIQMLGPSPQDGDWISSQKEGEWIWKTADLEAQSRMKSGDRLVYCGDRPEFKDGFWLFLGATPEFSYYAEGKLKGSKILVDNFGILVLAKNSSEEIALPTQSDLQEVKRIYFNRKVSRPLLKPALSSSDEKKESRSVEGLRKLADDLKKGVQEHLEVTSTYGYPPGKWEFVCNQPKGHKGYIYVPFEAEKKSESVRHWKEYWFYSGPKDPLLKKGASDSSWLFYGDLPVKAEKFKDLQLGVQSFLLKKYPTDEGSKSKAIEQKSPKEAPKKEEDLPQWDSAQLAKNPMILSLLLSEMMIRNTESPKEWAQQFCYQVSQLMNGVRTELWVYQKEVWNCTNTWDGSPGEFQTSLSRVESFPWTSDAGVLVSPILVRVGDEEEVIGALLFGGADQVSVDSAQAFSVMAKGLLRGVRGE